MQLITVGCAGLCAAVAAISLVEDLARVVNMAPHALERLWPPLSKPSAIRNQLASPPRPWYTESSNHCTQRGSVLHGISPQCQRASDSEQMLFNNICKIFKDYSTADILLVDDDPIIACLVINRLKKLRIKRDKDDSGRLIKIVIANNSNKFLDDIKCGSTYGVILVDENLGPDSYTGSQCIRKIRKYGYANPIISISGSYKTKHIVNKLKECGSDAFIPKSPLFLNELKNNLQVLILKDNLNSFFHILNT